MPTNLLNGKESSVCCYRPCQPTSRHKAPFRLAYALPSKRAPCRIEMHPQYNSLTRMSGEILAGAVDIFPFLSFSFQETQAATTQDPRLSSWLCVPAGVVNHRPCRGQIIGLGWCARCLRERGVEEKCSRLPLCGTSNRKNVWGPKGEHRPQ